MSYREPLSQAIVAISISESPGMAPLGLANEHLTDAMAETARHLLALGARLAYGGDLRAGGFTELLFELVARHRRDADLGDTRPAILSYLPWPAHRAKSADELRSLASELEGLAEVKLLDQAGQEISFDDLDSRVPTAATPAELADSLTAMRDAVTRDTDFRIVLGGRVQNFAGRMPGIAEEALSSLNAGQPLFLLGGFGGCARDIAEDLGLVPRGVGTALGWPERQQFANFTPESLRNELELADNELLARTVHIDQAIALVLRGLMRIVGDHQVGAAAP